MVKYLLLLSGLILSSCDNCSLPSTIKSNEELPGTYIPDEDTISKLTKMGFHGSPQFIIDRDLNLAVVNMPVVWRDWNWQGNIMYDKARGTVNVISSGQFFMNLEELNDIKTKTAFAGSELCKDSGKLNIRIPYQGWDNSEYLVFKRHET